MEANQEYVYADLGAGLCALGDEEESLNNPIKAEGYRMLAEVYNDMANAIEIGKPVAWISVAVPPEIFHAMDIMPFCDPVSFGLLGALEGVIHEPMDLAKEYVPDYVCSTNRLPLGLILAGMVPKPDVLVTQTNPCDSILGLETPVSKYFDIPMFSICTPHVENEAGIRYVTEEMKRFVTFLEEQTGRKLDHDRLREVMKHSNRSHEALLKLNSAAQHRPSAFTLKESMLDYGLAVQCAGKPDFADYLERVYADTKARMDGLAPYPIEEKMRIVWTYLVPAYDFIGGVFDWLEETYSATSVTFMNENVVVEPGADITSYDGMMMALAKKSLAMPMSRECKGSTLDLIDATVTMVREYGADGAVFAGHVGCKSNWAAQKVVKDAIQEALDIPVMNMEMDVIDKRVAPTENMIHQLEEFMPRVAQSVERKRAMV